LLASNEEVQSTNEELQSVNEELHTVSSCWKAIHEDGPEFPGGQHPFMVALQTGQPVIDIVRSVFNPQRDQPRSFRVSAIPLFNPGEKNYFRFSQLSMTSLK